VAIVVRILYLREMSKIVSITLPFDQNVESLLKKKYPDLDKFRILSQSLDARHANRGKKPQFIYRCEIIGINEKLKQ